MDEGDLVRRMAELLKSGATMLSQTCPACGTPLFKLKSGEVFCPKCGSRVFIVTSEKDEVRVHGDLALLELERVLNRKLVQLASILNESSLDDMDLVSDIIVKLLDALERVRKLGHKSK